MSQLVRAIMAKDTGKRVVINNNFSPCFKDVFYSMEDFHKVNLPEIALIYRIGVEFTSEVMVTETQIQKDKTGTALEQAVTRTKEHIIQAVFGEFREDIYQLHKAIYDMDFSKSRELLTSLERKMFSTE